MPIAPPTTAPAISPVCDVGRGDGVWVVEEPAYTVSFESYRLRNANILGEAAVNWATTCAEVVLMGNENLVLELLDSVVSASKDVSSDLNDEFSQIRLALKLVRRYAEEPEELAVARSTEELNVLELVFGQSVDTPSPWKNNPIKLVGSAHVPTQTSFNLSDMCCKLEMQAEEQGLLPAKSFAEQSAIGAL
jgi:hypothetical protein